MVPRLAEKQSLKWTWWIAKFKARFASVETVQPNRILTNLEAQHSTFSIQHGIDKQQKVRLTEVMFYGPFYSKQFILDM